MATEVIKVIPKGSATTKDDKGRRKQIFVFALVTVTNEAAPEETLFFCDLWHLDSVKKALGRLYWLPPEKPQKSVDETLSEAEPETQTETSPDNQEAGNG